MEVLLAIGETLLLGITAHVGMRYQTEQLALQKLITFLQKAEVLTPGAAVRSLVVPDASSTDLKDLVEGHNFVKGIGLFKGFVASDHIVSSMLNSSIRLVLSQLSLEQLLSNSRAYEEVEGKKEVVKANEFFLVDPHDKSMKLTIDNGNKMRCYQDALNVIKTEEHIRRLTPGERIVSWLMFSIKLFLSVNNFGKKASGFSIGIRRIERGIIIGQLLTVFGEFVFDKFNNELRIVNPQYFMKDKEQMLRQLKDANVVRSRNLTLVFALMTLFGFMLVKRLLRIGKLYSSKYLQKLRTRGQDAYSKLANIQVSGVECLCCRANPRSVIFKPCLHLAVCWHCDLKLSDRICPQCNAPVEEAINVFIG